MRWSRHDCSTQPSRFHQGPSGFWRKQVGSREQLQQHRCSTRAGTVSSETGKDQAGRFAVPAGRTGGRSSSEFGKLIRTGGCASRPQHVDCINFRFRQVFLPRSDRPSGCSSRKGSILVVARRFDFDRPSPRRGEGENRATGTGKSQGRNLLRKGTVLLKQVGVRRVSTA